MPARSILIITVIIAMPAIIAVLLTLASFRQFSMAMLLYSFPGSLLDALIGCIVGYSIGYFYVGSDADWSGVDAGLSIVSSVFLGWLIGAIAGGIIGNTVFWYRLDMRR